MLSFICLIIAAILGVCMSSTDTISEEVFWAHGKMQVLTLEQKVKRSLESAQLIAIGRFKLPDETQKLDAFSKDEAFLRVEFDVDRIITNNTLVGGKKIKFKLPIFFRNTKGEPSSPKADQKELDLAKEKIERLERDSAGKQIDKQSYEEEMIKARDTLLQSDKYLRDFVLVPLRVGGLDVPYRVTNVLVTFEQNCTLLLFKKKFDLEGATPFFPWELDIYLGLDERIIQLIEQFHSNVSPLPVTQ